MVCRGRFLVDACGPFTLKVAIRMDIVIVAIAAAARTIIVISLAGIAAAIVAITVAATNCDAHASFLRSVG